MRTFKLKEDIIKSDAIFSEDKKYRYLLSRQWQKAKPQVCFIMLNPSTATENVDDPSVRKCGEYARKWGYGGISIMNIFGFRSTDPKELKKVIDPIGKENDDHLLVNALFCDIVVCAWGMHSLYKNRGVGIKTLLEKHGVPLYYLELSKTGVPKHPLYLKGNLQPIKW